MYSLERHIAMMNLFLAHPFLLKLLNEGEHIRVYATKKMNPECEGIQVEILKIEIVWALFLTKEIEHPEIETWVPEYCIWNIRRDDIPPAWPTAP